MTKLGFVVNLDACSDHRGCMMACKAQKKAPLGEHYIETFTCMSTSEAPANTYFVPIMCQHCDNPACATACDKGVIVKRDDGLVVLGDVSACKGCAHPCVDACPYGRVFFDEASQAVGKCDGCADLVDAGGQPACIPNCWMNAIMFGDLEDTTALPGMILDQTDDAAVHELAPEAGTGPNTRYILQSKPWRDMEGLYSPAWHGDEPELELER